MFDWIDLIVGGIVIGFFVNIASSFAYPKIQEYFHKRKELSEKEKEELANAKEYLLQNPNEELRQRIDRIFNHNELNSAVIFQGTSTFLMFLFFSLTTEENLIKIFTGIFLVIMVISANFHFLLTMRKNRTFNADALNEIDKHRQNEMR